MFYYLFITQRGSRFTARDLPAVSKVTTYTFLFQQIYLKFFFSEPTVVLHYSSYIVLALYATIVLQCALMFRHYLYLHFSFCILIPQLKVLPNHVGIQVYILIKCITTTLSTEINNSSVI